MALDGGAGHTEQVGDLLDGLVASVLEPLGESCLAGVEFGSAVAGGDGRRSSVLTHHIATNEPADHLRAAHGHVPRRKRPTHPARQPRQARPSPVLTAAHRSTKQIDGSA